MILLSLNSANKLGGVFFLHARVPLFAQNPLISKQRSPDHSRGQGFGARYQCERTPASTSFEQVE
jgi:hypothetical protein